MTPPTGKECFSETYFDNYDGPGRSYRQFMALGVTDPNLLLAHLKGLGLQPPRSMLDLGAADGSALLHFQKSLPGLSAIHGVELSPYAYDRRLIDTIALGDMRDVLATPPDWMLPRYDLILMAAAMYFPEAELDEVMRQIRAFCHPETVVLVIIPGQCFPDGLFEYGALARRGLGAEATLLIRPKLWWLRRLSGAGYRVVGDIAGFGLLLQTDQSGASALDMGNAENAVASFSEIVNDGETACAQALRLRFREPAATMEFSFGRPQGFKQRTLEGVAPDDRGIIALLRDALALFRSGALGSTRQVTFLPVKVYGHAVGAICDPIGGEYHFRSDPNF